MPVSNTRLISTEDSYSVTRNIDGTDYFLSITDTAGQEEYRGLWAASNLKSDAFLMVYDITHQPSLEALDYFMDMIDIEAEQRLEDNQRIMKELGSEARNLQVGMPPPVKIVAGNKCDLKDARAISARDGLEYARKHGCGFMETSAREIVNIEETFARMSMDPIISMSLVLTNRFQSLFDVWSRPEGNIINPNSLKPAWVPLLRAHLH